MRRSSILTLVFPTRAMVHESSFPMRVDLWVKMHVPCSRKGSSFHEHFQLGLKMCKEVLIKKITVAVKLVYEPVNRRDENAILVHTKCENTRSPIGYIPGIQVPKVEQAIEDKETRRSKIVSRATGRYAATRFDHLLVCPRSWFCGRGVIVFVP